MARADRLERMDTQREALATEYPEALVAALRTTVTGAWGLFDHNFDHNKDRAAARRHSRPRRRPARPRKAP